MSSAPDRSVHSVPQVEKHSTISGKASGSVSTEWKQQRRAQIESALKSLDTGLDDRNARHNARLAQLNARLAQLEKETAEINAKNEKIRRDRERLLQELESYGTDTEGMGNVELQAQMDEIDLQKGIESGIQSEQVGATQTQHQGYTPTRPGPSASTTSQPFTPQHYDHNEFMPHTQASAQLQGYTSTAPPASPAQQQPSTYENSD